MKSTLEKNSFMLIIYSMFTNIINYLFQISSARVLDVASFGILSAVMSLFMIMSMPGNSLRLIAAKYVVDYSVDNKKNLEELISRILLYTGIFVSIFLITSAFFLGFIDSFLLINDKIICLFLLIIVALTIFQHTATGIAQGMQSLFIMSFIGLIVAVFKVGGVFASIFSPEGNRIIIIMLYMLIGTLLCSIIGIFMLIKKHKLRLMGIGKLNLFRANKISLSFIGASLITNVCLTFLVNIDVLYVRVNFDSYTSGLYGAAAQFGKILFFTVSALINALYPLVTEQAAQNKSAIKLYLKTLAYILAIITVFILPMIIFPNQIVTIIYGKKYLDCTSYIHLSCITAIAVSLNMLNLNYLLAINKVKLLSFTFICGTVLCAFYAVFVKLDLLNTIYGLCVIMVLVYVINTISIFMINIKSVRGGINNAE